MVSSLDHPSCDQGSEGGARVLAPAVQGLQYHDSHSRLQGVLDSDTCMKDKYDQEEFPSFQ